MHECFATPGVIAFRIICMRGGAHGYSERDVLTHGVPLRKAALLSEFNSLKKGVLPAAVPSVQFGSLDMDRYPIISKYVKVRYDTAQNIRKSEVSDLVIVRVWLSLCVPSELVDPDLYQV